MAKLSPVIRAFGECERQLRAALSDAASDADPEQLTRLVGWLTDVQRMLADANTRCGENGSAARQTATTSASTEPRAVQRSAKYPQFYKSGQSLLKVGWSRKTRTEYEHKAPKSALVALIGALAEVGKNRKKFTMEGIMPVADQAGQPVPDYQSYLCLAWIRDELKLVTQHGRQGYTLAGSGDLPTLVEQHWDSLTTR